MKNSTFFYIMLVLLLPLTSIAQNLVTNGGFDVYYPKKCPESMRSDDLHTEMMPGWNWPTVHGTSDVFNSCGPTGLTNVPNNSMANCPAKNGNGYVGFILKTHKVGGKDYREYIQTQLSQPLEKDKMYCVSMFYRLADCSTFSIDRLGMYFSGTEVNINTDKNLNYEPQLETPENVFLENDSEWKPLYNMYRAKGGEQFLLIGNFRADDATREKEHRQSGNCKSNKDYAYYFVDSVQVMEVKWECEPCPCVPQDLTVDIERGKCFNGGTDLYAEVSGGTEPYRKFYWENGLTERSFNHAITGKHEVTVIDDWGCKAKATVEFDCGQPLDALVEESGYTGGEDGFIKLKVTGGIPPFQFKWSNGATTKDINNLAFGKYQFTVTDNQGAQDTGTVVFSVPKLTVKPETYYTDSLDGRINLKVLTGLEPYTYQWKTGETTADRENLGAGVYVYTVTDAAKQTVTDSVVFIAPIKVAVTTGYSFEEDGSINLAITGGCPPYTIKWSNDSTTAGMKYLDNGLYKYTIVGACGKTATDTVRIKGKIILNNVLFKTGSADLLSESFPELDRVVAYMTRKDKIRVEISGHTDNVGSDNLNKSLSESRAKSVVEYISSKGIDIGRLVFVGYGKERPMATNDTKEGRALNRRVEFDITD